LETDVSALQQKTADQSWGSLTGTSFSSKVNVGGGGGVVLNTGSASEFNSGITTDLVRSFNNNDLVLEGRGSGDAILKTNGTNRVRCYDNGQINVVGTGIITVEGSGIAINATAAGIQTFATTSSLIQSTTTTTLTSGGETEINCAALDINATGTATLDASGFAINATTAGIQTFATTSSLIQSTTTTTLTSGGETEINCTALDINATGIITIDTTELLCNTTVGDITFQAEGSLLFGATTGYWTAKSSSNFYYQGSDNYIVNYGNQTGTAFLETFIDGTASDIQLYSSNCKISMYSDVGVLIGGAADPTDISGSQINILGTTDINTTTTSNTNIGNNTGSLNLKGNPIELNTVGVGDIFIGNALSNIFITPDDFQVNASNTVDINSVLTTDIKSVGTVNIDSPNVDIVGTTTIFGPTDINFTSADNTRIGNTGTLTLKGSTYNCTTTGNQSFTATTGDFALTGSDVVITSTGTGVGEFVVRANTNVDIKTTTGDIDINANTTMLLRSGGTNTLQVDGSNKMITTTNTTTLSNTTLTLNGNTTINPDNTFNMMPTATIIQNVSATVPSGFLYCDGQAVSRTITYNRLFAAIGTTFGVGNGTTTFNVPDFRGAFLRGAGSQTKGTPSITYTAAAVGTAQQDQVLLANYSTQNGYHNLASGGTGKQCPSRAQITSDPIDTGGILAQFARQGTENRPFNYSVYYYIRY
jgi:hypothetical protein